MKKQDKDSGQKIQKRSVWKKVLYVFLLLIFLAIGAGVWAWGISIVLSFIISVISIAMIRFFWEELNNKEENVALEKQDDTIK